MYHKQNLSPLLGSLALLFFSGLVGCDETPSESTTMTPPMAGDSQSIGGNQDGNTAPIAGSENQGAGGTQAPTSGGTDGMPTGTGGSDGTGPQIGGHTAGPEPDPQPMGQMASLRANVRFKGVHRLKGDWSRALALPPDELCRELDAHDCFDFVHTIALGGIDPYDSQVYEASDSLAINAPLVVERVALAACGTRYDRDLSVEDSDEAVFYKDIELSDDHSIVDIDSPGIEQYIERLYNRILLRMPTAQEVQTLRDFYPTLVDIPGGEKHARDWGVLTCFMVLTSTESLFY